MIYKCRYIYIKGKFLFENYSSIRESENFLGEEKQSMNCRAMAHCKVRDTNYQSMATTKDLIMPF